MARLAPMVMRFRQTSAPDFSGENRVYVFPDGTPFDYDNAGGAANVAVFSGLTADADGFTRVDLAEIVGWDQLDGIHDIFVTALDGRGNESDPLEVADASFDFRAPTAPTEGAIE